MIVSPLQTASTSGTNTVASVVLFLGLLVAVIISAIILLRGIQGFRRAHNPALLGLSIGIAFTSGLPIVMNTSLSTFTVLDNRLITIVTNGLRLLGLGIILYVIDPSRGDHG
ncbi:hypothetical protein ACFR9U_15785 [Halorientalis brevis]|uniref:Uncharacterized protein n=1 Tax=Halorientalis brevis TaxID=1126241 RepID=A0ABD6CEF2_9EURY|nr:hypothetical protein [Halorientalis brevis]